MAKVLSKYDQIKLMIFSLKKKTIKLSLFAAQKVCHFSKIHYESMKGKKTFNPGTTSTRKRKYFSKQQNLLNQD
jgi:hypothetical protein